MSAPTPIAFDGEYDALYNERDPQIRQGDVFQFFTGPGPRPRSGDDWAAYFGVAVTANCDLVHGKHAGVLSYAPVVPVNVYASLIALPRVMERLRRQAEASLQDILPVGGNWPTLDRLLEMVGLGETVENIRRVLPASDDTDAVVKCVGKVAACAPWRRNVERATATTHDEVFSIAADVLARLRDAEGSRKKPSRSDLLRSELRNNLLKQLPGDALFLSKVSQSDAEGYIAYLRLIREISVSRIATSPVMESRMGEEVVARRIGRLSTLYVHRLLQQMASVFTDIGLPSDYETHRDRTIDGLIHRWAERLSAS